MLAPWKKNYDKSRQHIKNRAITLPTKVLIVKAMVFPVVMYECESWTIKKPEQWKIDAFELCYLRGLEDPMDSKEIKLKKISPKYSLERLMLKMKLENFGHLM